MKSTALFAAATLASSIALGAGFDCQKAATRVEKLICENGQLGRLDSRLDSAYRLALNEAYPAEKPQLVSAQKQWLRSVRDRCDTTDCLLRAYSERLAVLSLVKTEKSAAEYVLDEKELADQVSSFEEALRQSGIGGKLSHCNIVIRLLEPGIAGHDAGYGAICDWNAHPMMLCDDTMIGKLTLKLGSFAISSRTLADYTQANCPPGG